MVTRRSMLTVMGSIVTLSLAGAAIETRIAQSSADSGQRRVDPPAGAGGLVVAPADAPLGRAGHLPDRNARHTGG
ncbi:hypothetical protein HJ588_04850 [Flexivirga sp. ID2601S]|uniref:Uncharacterized protein n=1 Tax=Flexivirga aerilata TaxID=1656889 RepID=A0A849ADM4_9MICO|nr:hypothetical protein [Flexivirga aerilata]NNG38605.1 hypothetical protein [Flexivirga aerilata]